MLLSARPVYIVAAKRTPFGTFGGKLKDLTATDLQVEAVKAALAAGKVDPTTVDSVVVGNVAQTSADAPYLARHAGLRADIPIRTPALTVNRLCGSGFQSIINAAHDILIGDAAIAVAGGTESMSQAPFAARDIRWGVKLSHTPKLEDTLWSALTDSYIKLPMAITAENLAAKYQVTRADADEFALVSQQRWAKAHAEGRFNAEIAPIGIKGKKGIEKFEVDEHPRPATTIETLAKLSPVFKADGVVTAGNASGICDGAAALVLASEEAVKTHNLKPLARLVSYGISGVDPSIMGIGPAPAIRQALSRANLTLDKINLVEVNEAFAAQFVAVERELKLDRDISNTNGGAIALGHPLGASGARIVTHLTHELQRTNGKYAVGSACIGGGQGIAVILERV
ncbi:acetyl-CoA C-acetyltransferase [Capsaspora owczarzaki ATCC 30864]|uniref:Acetyl-CoA C-acetyltransferase n=1 Tax=Capsaspora owczarzaki (strain ATCC 30864) TaxID=595528 RepID=A0A0D2WT35_CAPO3|nr:acetyl-CoA C-acetyltransferase [Capsaspora owczarzaki ATCC 30864]KJE95505.1 acetyl-CoA C-acetyltransferase [Capsaspora owczarzaki ATCC 30864]|eukprot:XP_004345543.1 acetyl-CoA C-acetyltransferase [Capsaspora owczarzaki ATCC 30864]